MKSTGKYFPAAMESRKLSSPSSRKTKGGSSVWTWTNERHLDYLNSMEASFVQTMLNPLPLNRYLPDISDSTLDRRTPPARRYSTSDILESTNDKRTRRLPYSPYNIITTAQDQVVPQYESRRTNNTKTDERDHKVDIAPAN